MRRRTQPLREARQAHDIQLRRVGGDAIRRVLEFFVMYDVIGIEPCNRLGETLRRLQKVQIGRDRAEPHGGKPRHRMGDTRPAHEGDARARPQTTGAKDSREAARCPLRGCASESHVVIDKKIPVVPNRAGGGESRTQGHGRRGLLLRPRTAHERVRTRGA